MEFRFGGNDRAHHMSIRYPDDLFFGEVFSWHSYAASIVQYLGEVI